MKNVFLTLYFMCFVGLIVVIMGDAEWVVKDKYIRMFGFLCFTFMALYVIEYKNKDDDGI